MPFNSIDLAPLYNYYYGSAGAPDASSDATLKGKFSNLGICASIFIPFGRPKVHSDAYNPKYNNDSTDPTIYDNSEAARNKRDVEQNRKAGEQMDKNAREERQNNERQHERERKKH